mmetsp:Transcript_82061/g.148118  ORF Transcript_82061/g.148118 Transcript_82061/m.148118 type:complete len:80 (-) Transcript_82061:54-293(-)
MVTLPACAHSAELDAAYVHARLEQRKKPVQSAEENSKCPFSPEVCASPKKGQWPQPSKSDLYFIHQHLPLLSSDLLTRL